MSYEVIEIINDLETIRLQIDIPRYPNKTNVLRKELDDLIEKWKGKKDKL